MKSTIIFLLGLLAFPIISDVVTVVDYHTTNETVSKAYVWMIHPSYGISDVLIENCTKDVSKNGHGWVFVNREYFQCNKAQIYFSDLIFGETTR